MVSEQARKKRLAVRRRGQAIKLFKSAVANKRADHWKLCLASYFVVGLRDGKTERLAQENDGVSVDSIEDYARTYRLYRALRIRNDRLRSVGVGRYPEHKKIYNKAHAQTVRDLRDLRKEVHYTKWLIVANGVYTGFREPNGARRKLTMQQALDALKSAGDGSTEMFAAFVAGAEISQARTVKKAHKILSQLLSYPMAKRKRQTIKKAWKLLDLEVSNNGKNKANTKKN